MELSGGSLAVHGKVGEGTMYSRHKMNSQQLFSLKNVHIFSTNEKIIET